MLLSILSNAVVAAAAGARREWRVASEQVSRLAALDLVGGVVAGRGGCWEGGCGPLITYRAL
eukprot:SAG25_NODE_93_length_16012_cov_22.660341_12_plen_62_part_00